MSIIHTYEDSEIMERVMPKGKEENGKGGQRLEDGLMDSREGGDGNNSRNNHKRCKVVRSYMDEFGIWTEKPTHLK